MLEGDKDELVRTGFRQEVVLRFQVVGNILQRLLNSVGPFERAVNAEIQILY